MIFNVRGAVWVLAAMVLVAGICFLDVRCSSDDEDNRTYVRVKSEMEFAWRAKEEQRMEDLAKTARDLRRMSVKLRSQGDERAAKEAEEAADRIERELKRKNR